MVCLKTSRVAPYALSQRFFGLRTGTSGRANRILAQGNGFLGEGFPGSHNRVGTVPAETGRVSHPSDRELRRIKELWRRCGRSLRCRCLRRLESEINLLRLFRAEKKGRNFGIAVAGTFGSQRVDSAADCRERIVPLRIGSSR